MSSLVIAGDTSGTVTLQAPAVAGSTVINLPATSGTLSTGNILLGTLTTTSGTTQTLSNLDLTNYSFLYIVVDGVSFTTDVAITINNNTATTTVVNASSAFLYGNIQIDLVSSFGYGFVVRDSAPLDSAILSTSGTVFNSGLTTASTSITFAGGTFDAGTIKVYGVS